MLTVRNKQQLEMAYSMLRYYEKMRHTVSPTDLCDEHIREMKREIRRFVNRPVDETIIVKDYGIDGALLLYPCPDHVKNENDAEFWFMAEEFIPMPNSAYDCTGMSFTTFHKPVLRHGRWYMYHEIHRDV